MGGKSIMPVLLAEKLEPCRDFWNKLGFDTKHAMPEDGSLAYLEIGDENISISYQDRTSAGYVIPHIKDAIISPSNVSFVFVDNPKEYERKLSKDELLIPYRETMYGTAELWCKDPAGYVFCLGKEIPKQF